MSRPVRTVLIDENDLFGECLRRVLSETSFPITRSFGTLEAISETFSAKACPQLFLWATRPLTRCNVPEGIGHLKQHYPTTRVVILSDEYDFDYVISTLHAGANGLLHKNVDPATLEKSLQLVMLGQTVLSSKIIDLLTRADSSQQLAREALGSAQHRADTLNSDRS